MWTGWPRQMRTSAFLDGPANVLADLRNQPSTRFRPATWNATGGHWWWVCRPSNHGLCDEFWTATNQNNAAADETAKPRRPKEEGRATLGQARASRRVVPSNGNDSKANAKWCRQAPVVSERKKKTQRRQRLQATNALTCYRKLLTCVHEPALLDPR